MRCLIRSAAWVVAGMLWITPQVAMAQKNLAITDPEKADADFQIQGEYVGSQLANQPGHNGCWHAAALQVVALGNGQFTVVRYQGGLPGAGWNGAAVDRLQAKRHADGLQLEDGSQLTLNGACAWHAHSQQDLGRYQKIHRVSPTLGAAAPTQALTLFDGTDTAEFKNGKMTDDGLLMIGTEFKRRFQDFHLHLEFRLPYMPNARGQGRANSGVYLQSRYEVQILDSFGLEGKENECGALYRYRKPRINMCLPPLTWQTYDIEFRSPEFDDAGKKTVNGRLTVRHNGVLIHDDAELERKTGAGAQESPQLLPIKLQNHGNPVHFRNIWIVDRSQGAAAEAACQPVVGACCAPCDRDSGLRRLLKGLFRRR